MATQAVTLTEPQFQAAQRKAKELGTTTDAYVGRLIEAQQALDESSFDQLLEPVRKGFESMDDEQLDRLLSDARRRAAGDTAA
jgi:predicted negative regulator of RcsB-dependent stress response